MNPPIYRLVAGEGHGGLLTSVSPWASDRTILVVTGTDPAGINAAAEALARDETLGELRGRRAAIVRGVAPMTEADSAVLVSAPASLAPKAVIPISQQLAV